MEKVLISQTETTWSKTDVLKIEFKISYENPWTEFYLLVIAQYCAILDLQNKFMEVCMTVNILVVQI